MLQYYIETFILFTIFILIILLITHKKFSKSNKTIVQHFLYVQKA